MVRHDFVRREEKEVLIVGSYLIVDGKENNSKSISYPMINLMREILPEKKSLYGERVFAMTQDEVAKTLYGITEILNNEWTLKDYIKNHSEEYSMDDEFEEIKENFEWIHRCFAKILSEMIICDKRNILCEWE